MARSPSHSTRPPLPAGWQVDRRDFLRASGAALAGLFAPGCAGVAAARRPFRFGLVTDLHYADAPSRGTRHYRESIAKAREAVDRLRTERAAFLAVLGDIKDMAAGESEEQTFAHLVAIEREIRRFGGPTYHVLGNHDMDNLPKPRVVAHLENTGIARDRSFYAFSRGGLRFIVLDACYDQAGRDYDRGKFDWRDANIPARQLTWLEAELAVSREPAIVFVHQRLDGSGHASIRNREDVRRVLERPGRVLAVFQGHDHPGGYTLINGIHYYTLRAVIEGTGEASNAYALVDVSANLGLTVTGYRRAVSANWPRQPAA